MFQQAISYYYDGGDDDGYFDYYVNDYYDDGDDYHDYEEMYVNEYDHVGGHEGDHDYDLYFIILFNDHDLFQEIDQIDSI